MTSAIRKRHGGFYTVEAAIFLPIFLVAVLTIGYLIKVVGSVETSMHAATDEARLAAANAYTAFTSPGLSSRIERRITDDNRLIEVANVKNMRYLADDGEISFTMDYHIDVRLPLGMYDGFDVTDRLKCRGWVGKANDDPLGFAAMEENEASQTVYVFPAWGEKYHRKSCSFVTASPALVTLSSLLKRKYHACPRCKSGELTNGSIVYCFPNYGDAYHRGDCDSIKKYTVAMQKDQAERRGYTPCSKCGGI